MGAGGYILAYEEQIHGNNIETKANESFDNAFLLWKRSKPVRYQKNFSKQKTCLV
jgi:hypothetical protein